MKVINKHFYENMQKEEFKAKHATKLSISKNIQLKIEAVLCDVFNSENYL